jgi:hypothetical protein
VISIEWSDRTRDEFFDRGFGFLSELLSGSYFLTELFDMERDFEHIFVGMQCRTLERTE